jgi:hypothetical protein
MNADRPLKVGAIRQFLAGRYPTPSHTIEDRYDHDREAHMFRVVRDGKNLCTLGASREFLDDHTAPQITALLGDRVIEELERRKTFIIVNEPPPGRRR